MIETSTKSIYWRDWHQSGAYLSEWRIYTQTTKYYPPDKTPENWMSFNATTVSRKLCNRTNCKRMKACGQIITVTKSQGHIVTKSQDLSDQKEVSNKIWWAFKAPWQEPFAKTATQKYFLLPSYVFGWVDTGICGLRGGLILYKMRLFNWTSNLSGWADWSRKSRSRKLI